MLFLSRVFLAFASVHCCLSVTCWEGAGLLALICDVLLCFITFPCGILGQVWYLIVSIPDHCRLSYFQKIIPITEKHFLQIQICNYQVSKEVVQ